LRQGALFFAAPRLVIIVPPRLARDASPRVVMRGFVDSASIIESKGRPSAVVSAFVNRLKKFAA
jgi:hypothetical protein